MASVLLWLGSGTLKVSYLRRVAVDRVMNSCKDCVWLGLNSGMYLSRVSGGTDDGHWGPF